MTRKKTRPFPELLDVVASRLKPPLCFALGSPREVVDLLASHGDADTTSFQFDLYQADRIRTEAAELDLPASIECKPDLWDLPNFQTVVFPVSLGGERALKLDIIEQAYHVLAPGGVFVVLSPYEKDDFFAPALKKVFGRVHAPMEGGNNVFWCQREGERQRRRHEMTFHVRVDEETSYSFTSRPGVFSYGRFDFGARAMCEAMEIPENARVADLGCGVGTNGILAARRAGQGGSIAFVDSNVRAIALTELNAHALGVPNFETFATPTVAGPTDGTFDVVLANPPYIAQMTVARLFMDASHRLLKKGGTFYLVTKQIEAVNPLMEETYGSCEIFENRGYYIFVATR